MEDCCAVCAESLEWVAYGSCGHRDVCSTCVVRLRFVLSDCRCCICKTECPAVFITRALGSFTESRVNFLDFPPGATEGQHGKYWYHEDSKAFFDDVDHYKMISAMCRLSCSVCDNNAEELRRDSNSRKRKFVNMEQLKGHLYHQHRMFMCNLCLEGRKVFISEQKLYTRVQLTQHVSTGDSEVDGTESERGGFAGHPMCEFCKSPFYGDAELYMHMSREHFTCHICQRQHPGQYDYYRNYEDLETHFRQEHFLCENESCIAKKFVVFQSDSEMKRHNAIEHGGHMSRAKRNAALQIPVSFRFRRNENDRGGRRHDLRSEPSSDQMTLAIQASLEAALSEGKSRESSSSHGQTSQADVIASSFEPLAITSQPEPLSSRSVLQDISFPPLSDFEPPPPASRYAQALNQRSGANWREESFPPLHGVKESFNKPKPEPVSNGLAADTIAARISKRNKGAVKLIHSAQPRPIENHELGSIASSSSHMRPAQISPPTAPSNSSSYASALPANSAWNSRIKHSASAPNLQSSSPSDKEPSSIKESLPRAHAGNIQRANKSLVESIRSGLGMDENKYAVFRSISAEYRQGLINSPEYLSYVEQFGLLHLVLDLAQLCPDPLKQKELIDAYNASILENGGNAVGSKKGARKGKEKQKAGNSTAKDALADSILEQVRKLQSGRHPSEGEVEVLTKDGYRANNGKTPSESNVGENLTSTNSDKCGEGAPKRNKKTSKFHRVRLGDSSAYLNLRDRQASPEKSDDENISMQARGVWGKGGGGQRLFPPTGMSK